MTFMCNKVHIKVFQGGNRTHNLQMKTLNECIHVPMKESEREIKADQQKILKYLANQNFFVSFLEGVSGIKCSPRIPVLKRKGESEIKNTLKKS